MDLKQTYEKIRDMFSQIKFTVKEEKEDSIRFTAEVTLSEYYKDGIFISTVLYTSGVMHMFFTFDHLDESLETLRLLNTFNDHSSWFKAYISDKGEERFLELHYAACGPEDEDACADNFGFVMRQLMSDVTLKYLTPICSLTF